jgi:hypothetical protein
MLFLFLSQKPQQGAATGLNGPVVWIPRSQNLCTIALLNPVKAIELIAGEGGVKNGRNTHTQ